MTNQHPKYKYFGTYIDRNYRIIRLKFFQVFKELDLDITPEQWVILDNLHQKDGQSQTDLANSSFKEAPTISRIIDHLCDKGLTQRQSVEADRRKYNVFLTPTGKQLYEKALPGVLTIREAGWKNLSDEDYRHFLRIMDQLFENLQQDSSNS